MNNITFGTDGWRAVIGDDFTYESVRKVAAAAAEVFAQECDGEVADNRLMIGYDMRFEAGSFAAVVAEVLAEAGFEVLLSDQYIPTPGLCYCIAHDDKAIGGLMLTASHNPSPWLGIKVRMADGGASPSGFTNRIEEVLEKSPAKDCPSANTPLGRVRENGFAHSGCRGSLPPSQDSFPVKKVDLVERYLEGLRGSLALFAPSVAPEPQSLKVVIDPMYGAAQKYLAQIMREQGVEVVEIHSEPNPSFGGLHPEPIPPWTDDAAKAVAENKAAAAFITDGDGDRIGAIDENGIFVGPHKIIALLTQHLVEDLGRAGRIIKTFALSNTIDRLGTRLKVPVNVRPIGFKWVYEEMLKGDVLVGGEESGGIGIPDHVRERDGLLMSLLLLQMMRMRNKTLGELVKDLEDTVGTLHYLRRDLKLDPKKADYFRTELVHSSPAEMAGRSVRAIDRMDGMKLQFDNDEWLLLRGSGTEPLIRIYAEANTPEQLNAYLDAGSAYVQGESA